MENRKPLHLFFGIVLVILGAAFGLALPGTAFRYIRNATVPHLWTIGRSIIFVALGAFCIWNGTREFRRATGQKVNKPGFRWGRLLAGTYILFFSLNSHFAPSPNRLKADNEAEAAGMMIANMVGVLLGVLLIVCSFDPREAEPALELTAGTDEEFPAQR
jgi:hypothetical protein